MKSKVPVTDPEVAGALAAMKRASDRALALAKSTGTPYYIMKNGKIVNLNPNRARRKVKHPSKNT